MWCLDEDESPRHLWLENVVFFTLFTYVDSIIHNIMIYSLFHKNIFRDHSLLVLWIIINGGSRRLCEGLASDHIALLFNAPFTMVKGGRWRVGDYVCERCQWTYIRYGKSFKIGSFQTHLVTRRTCRCKSHDHSKNLKNTIVSCLQWEEYMRSSTHTLALEALTFQSINQSIF